MCLHGNCFLYLAGAAPVAPGYGGGYPQQYYQGTNPAPSAHVHMLNSIDSSDICGPTVVS